MNEKFYKDKVASLPKPKTLEEQYIYALVCDVAGVENKYGYYGENTTKNPIWRLDKYWKAFYEVTAKRATEPNVPSTGTVTTSTLDAAVEAQLLGEGRITTAMIQNGAVTSELIKDGSIATNHVQDKAITEQKLADAVVERLLADKKITLAMLSDAIAAKLLNDGVVTEAMLSSDLKKKLKI